MKFLNIRYILLLIMITYYCGTYGQRQEILSNMISYTFKGDSEVDIVDYDFDLKLYKKPLKNKKGFFGIGLTSSYTMLDYDIAIPSENELERFYDFGIAFSHLRVWNKRWSSMVVLRPQLSSNFTSEITYDDFNPSALFLLNYSKNRQKNRLSFGLAYSANNAIGVPIVPVLSYWKKINERAEMTLGFPETSLAYKFSPKTTITSLIKFDGFNYNISENFKIQEEVVDYISYTELKIGLELKQKLLNIMNVKLLTGYTLARNLELVDESLDKVHAFDMKSNFNISLGIGINIDGKKKRSKE